MNLRGLAISAIVVLLAGGALAHQSERTVVRELVWLKGRHAGAEVVVQRAERPRRGEPGSAPLVLVALGTEHRFAVTELKRFPVGDAAATPATDFERGRLVLQGPRELLARFAGARPDQTVTILAERRPDGPDLFLIALDLCP